MSQYKPTSHFFVDETKLATILTANYNDDAFGPIAGSLTTKYRTSSFVRSTDANPVKVFAICDGQLFVQPCVGDATKINLILKPSAPFSPLKIKYFIYRGVRKLDLLGGIGGSSSYLTVLDPNNINQPSFLKKIWDQYTAFITAIKDPSTGDPLPAPTEFLSSSIGYDEDQSSTILLDHCFTKKGITNSLYEIPLCIAGEHIANFTSKMALDIVLDYGDYELQNQEQLFKLDLEFARKSDHFFDTSTITSPLKIKRYKENIFQFLDVAAFYGSHIENGKIISVTYPSSSGGTNDNTNICNNFLNKFQTQNKIYIYIKGEKNRSYNYYETSRKVAFDLMPNPKNLVFYNTNDWPILIKEENIPVDNSAPGILFYFEYDIDSNIDQSDKHVAFDVIPSNNVRGSFPQQISNLLRSNGLKIYKNNLKSVSTFFMFHVNAKQGFPLIDYFNHLFPATFSPAFEQPSILEKMTYWATYDHNRMHNISDVIGVGATIQNKLVFDTGKSQPSTPLKRRRLYMAIVKSNTNHDTDKVFDELNTQDVTSGIVKKTISKDQYILNLYNDSDFSLFKGAFTDGSTINSLALKHNKNLIKKNSFFHLGITDEEYNKLVYNNITIVATQYLPHDADNIFFYFEEVTTFVNQNVRKLKLGLQYEDNAGSIVTLFPTPSTNDVFVYTLDGLYFFSKDYSELQEFYDEFSVNQIHFRPVPTWAGEFGFDWERIGDSGLPGDTLLTATTPDRTYKNIFGHYYVGATNVKNDESNGGTFRIQKSEYISFLNRNYFTYPKINSVYSSSFLNIYPSKDILNNVLPFPKTNSAGNLKCLTEVLLNLKITITVVPTSLRIVCEKDFFEISSITASEIVVASGLNPLFHYFEIVDKSIGIRNLAIKIKCSKEFSENKKVKVIAIENNIEKIVGEMIVLPNAKSYRKTTKIAFVNCETEIVPGTIKNGLNLGATFNQLLEEKITKFFNQCLIDIIMVENRDFNLKPTGLDYPTFNANNVFVDPVTPINNYIEATRPIATGGNKYIHEDLMLNLFIKFPELQTDFLVLFFMNEDAGSSTDVFFGLAEGPGFSPNRKSVALFNGGIFSLDPITSAPIPLEISGHELFHCLQNQHPFVNSNNYTSEKSITENIMDYSLQNTINPIEGVSIWQYQGILSKKHNLIVNEL